MPVCSSGISQPRSGAAETVILTSAVLASLLPADAWLVPFIGAAAGIITLDLPTFCAVDPPADPGVSAADIISLLTLGPGPLTADASARVQQLIQRYAWYSFCECASVVTPQPPTFPTAPTGLPSLNPPGFVGTPSGPCGSTSASRFVSGSTTHRDLYTGAAFSTAILHPLPANCTEYQTFASFGLDGTPDTTTLGNTAVGPEFYNASNTFVGVATSPIDDAGTPSRTGYAFHTAIQPIPTGATQYALTWTTSGSSSGTAQCTLNFYCGGSATEPVGVTPCCTAGDPITGGALQAILQMVTLLQRQTAPFAYVPGPVHSGLTGTGTVSVQGILALHASANIPDSADLIGGTPDVAIDIGRLNLGTVDAFVDRQLLVLGDQLIVPALPGIFTVVGYTLRPGVTLELTELIREP